MKRYMEHYEYCSGLLEQRGGVWVKFKDAKTEIDSRDKRLVTLSIENRELQTKVAAQAKRIAELEALLAHGTAARSEMLDEIHARGARIAELKAAVKLVCDNAGCRRALSAPDWDQVRFSIGGRP